MLDSALIQQVTQVAVTTALQHVPAQAQAITSPFTSVIVNIVTSFVFGIAGWLSHHFASKGAVSTGTQTAK